MVNWMSPTEIARDGGSFGIFLYILSRAHIDYSRLLEHDARPPGIVHVRLPSLSSFGALIKPFFSQLGMVHFIALRFLLHSRQEEVQVALGTASNFLAPRDSNSTVHRYFTS